jgi:hypothetical protein
VISFLMAFQPKLCTYSSSLMRATCPGQLILLFIVELLTALLKLSYKYSCRIWGPTVVVIFWDVMPCSPLKVNGRFEEHIVSIFRVEHSSCHLRSRWFLAHLILLPWRWRRYVPPKRRLTFNGLQGVIFQKTELFTYNYIYPLSCNIWDLFP